MRRALRAALPTDTCLSYARSADNEPSCARIDSAPLLTTPRTAMSRWIIIMRARINDMLQSQSRFCDIFIKMCTIDSRFALDPAQRTAEFQYRKNNAGMGRNRLKTVENQFRQFGSP
ncbi:hypothetical protein Zmor_026168 [Zophobas morio]|uniref:Uncharacterized protein n=1 Tax=Zophobas morio TaxID=2755281 RepID=A0AA38HT40_9CUCU|nr:hypothetical protein Zmor_026168 [Zophobas morio]